MYAAKRSRRRRFTRSKATAFSKASRFQSTPTSLALLPVVVPPPPPPLFPLAAVGGWAVINGELAPPRGSPAADVTPSPSGIQALAGDVGFDRGLRSSGGSSAGTDTVGRWDVRWDASRDVAGCGGDPSGLAPKLLFADADAVLGAAKSEQYRSFTASRKGTLLERNSSTAVPDSGIMAAAEGGPKADDGEPGDLLRSDSLRLREMGGASSLADLALLGGGGEGPLTTFALLR